MSKRKTYFSRIYKLISEAKDEVLDIMESYGDDEVDISGKGVKIFEDIGRERYREVDVVVVRRVKDVRGEGYHLEFGCSEEDGSHWYINRLLWLDIHEAVFRHYNLYGKRYKEQGRDYII